MYQLKDSPFNSIVTDDAKKLKDIFKKHGYDIRIAGGAVRDVLIGKQPKDLDFATTASVLQMKEMFEEEGIKTVNTNGEEHGTVTACFKYPQQFEITTINVRNPGRPTKEDWIRDAERRDLTMNSMFLDFDGNVHDHLGGYDDLKKKKVRFANAEHVIKADHLRILRYFRFYSQFAKDPAQHEDAVLRTIKRNAAGLKRIAGERIWKELKIILQEKSRNVVIKIMMDVGIGPYIGLPKPNLAEFQNVSRKNRDTDIQPASLLAAMLVGKPDADRLRSRLKYSTEEVEMINYIMANRENTSDDSLLPYLQLIYSETKLSKDIIIKYVTELLQYKGAEELVDELQNISEFPIDMQMLKNNGVSLGPKLKQKRKYKFVVKELVEYWYEDDYDLSEKELLALIPKILQKYNEIQR